MAVKKKSVDAAALARAKKRNAASDKAKRAVGVKTPGRGSKGKPKSEAHKAAISAAMKKHHALRKKGKVKVGDKTKVSLTKKVGTAVKRAAKVGVDRAKAWAKRKETGANLKLAQIERTTKPSIATQRKLVAAHKKYKAAKEVHESTKVDHVDKKKEAIRKKAIEAGKKLLGRTIDLDEKPKPKAKNPRGKTIPLTKSEKTAAKKASTKKAPATSVKESSSRKAIRDRLAVLKKRQAEATSNSGISKIQRQMDELYKKLKIT